MPIPGTKSRVDFVYRFAKPASGTADRFAHAQVRALLDGPELAQREPGPQHLRPGDQSGLDSPGAAHRQDALTQIGPSEAG
jgi:hypothetical protein